MSVHQGCIQGQRQTENQLGTQEACGLKLVLENGLQIEIGSSGSTDLYTHIQYNGAEALREQAKTFLNLEEFFALYLIWMIFFSHQLKPLMMFSPIYLTQSYYGPISVIQFTWHCRDSVAIKTQSTGSRAGTRSKPAPELLRLKRGNSETLFSDFNPFPEKQ